MLSFCFLKKDRRPNQVSYLHHGHKDTKKKQLSKETDALRAFVEQQVHNRQPAHEAELVPEHLPIRTPLPAGRHFRMDDDTLHLALRGLQQNPRGRDANFSAEEFRDAGIQFPQSLGMRIQNGEELVAIILEKRG